MLDFFRNFIYNKYIKKSAAGVASEKETFKEKPIMGTPADSLVTQFPDRVSQLQGPVYNYLKKMSAKIPFNRTEQDLYMTVFYPAARRVDPSTPFSQIVPPKYFSDFAKQNPNIRTPQDYMNFVNNRKRITLSPDETAALNDTAGKLNVPADSLYKLINFESGWDPKATNPYSGARGLIQFMPSTASWMGFAATVAVIPLLILGGIVYFILKRQGYL
jgi:hypothetical protein